jgi:integrase
LFVKPSSWFETKSEVSDLTLFWLFLLGLTSGARLEEVGQAHLSDVKEDDGVLFIDIEDRIIDQAGLAGDAPAKSLKNEGSRRVVPIHPRLLALGFKEYCDALRKLGATMLFPDLKANQFGKYTKEASRRANRVINKCASADMRLVFHSLRHKFKDEGRAARVQDSILDQICGHAPATVGARYGEGVDLRSLQENLSLLRFDAVNWVTIEKAIADISWAEIAGKLVSHFR